MKSAEKKTRSLALKSKAAEVETNKDNLEEDSDTENLSLLTKKFQKFIKLKSRTKNQQSKRYNRKPYSNTNKLSYFGCGKQGHMKADCPNLTNTEKTIEKKNYKAGKGRKAYIAWEDNASSTRNSSQEDIEDMCLMAGKNFEVSSENSNTSIDSTNYSSLLQDFHHEEVNRLALSNNRLKSLNNWLEGRVKQLEDEILELKTDFDHLEMIYKASSSLDSSHPVNCENCEALQNKVNYLITTTSRLSMGTTNLNAILGSQNCVFEKASIGYQTGFQRKQKKYSSFFKTDAQQFSSPLTCFYCMRKGHSVKNCKIRKFDVSKGLSTPNFVRANKIILKYKTI